MLAVLCNEAVPCLLQALAGVCSKGFHKNPLASLHHTVQALLRLFQCLLQALAVCCSKSPDRPPLVTLQHIAQASMAVLEAALSGPAPIESRPASQLYAAALRALLAGLSEAKGQPGVGLLSLLGCLQKLLTFCARPAATSSAPLQRSPVNSGGLVAGSWVARQVPSR